MMRFTCSALAAVFCISLFSSATRSAFAELDDSSPPVLTGTIDSAAAKTVTLKLEDGRKTQKFPREFFPAGMDFYPGRIVSLKITDELRNALKTGKSNIDLSDAELFQIIRALQKASKFNAAKAKSGKNEKSSALDFASPIFNYLGISTAFAKPTDLCDPINYNGSLIQVTETRNSETCQYAKAAECAAGSSGYAAAKKWSASATAFVACSPTVYGPNLCTPAFGETTNSDAGCGSQYLSKCKALGLKEDDCTLKVVLPYAKTHAAEVKTLYAGTTEACAKDVKPELAVVDAEGASCSVVKHTVKALQTKLALVSADYEKTKDDERSASRCIPAPDDSMNKNLDDPKSSARFSTITGAMCGGKNLCVREVKCLDKIVDGGTPVSKFARCTADKCNSAEACLADTLATGSAKASDLKSSTTKAN
jgi:hypothetical protein